MHTTAPPDHRSDADDPVSGGGPRPSRGGRRSPEEAKREIIAVAHRFLWERPFRELSVGDLMAATSVGRSSFYTHFEDRYALAAALLDLIDEEFAEARKHDLDPRTLGEDLGRAVAVWQQHGPVIRAISEAAAQDERLEHLYRWVFLHGGIERLAGSIAAAQGEGRVASDLDPHEMGTLLVLLTERYLCDRLGRLPQADPAVALETLTRAWQPILGPRG